MTYLEIKKAKETTYEYCKTCTTRQLEDIYEDEKEKAERYGLDNETGICADIFAEVAKEEINRRNKNAL